MSKKKHIDEMFRDNLSDYKPDFDQSFMDSTWNGISESMKLPMDGGSSASSASGASGFS